MRNRLPVNIENRELPVDEYMIDREKSFDLEEPVLNLCLNKE